MFQVINFNCHAGLIDGFCRDGENGLPYVLDESRREYRIVRYDRASP